MFKLVVLSVLVAVAAAKPHEIVASLIGEKTIESHGNSVVHASAPLVAAAHAPALISAPLIAQEHHLAYASPISTYSAPAALIHEKTIESHGNSVIHSSAPIVAAAKIVEPAPLIYASYAAPGAALISEKTVSGYGHSINHGGPLIAHHAAYVAPSYAIL